MFACYFPQLHQKFPWGQGVVGSVISFPQKRPRGPQLKFTLKSNLIFFTFRPFFSLIYLFFFFFLCFFFFTFFALISLFSYFPSFIVTFSHFFSFFSFLYFYIAYGKAFGSRWQTLIKSHSPCWGFFYD
jgi:hypothetical protein